MLGEYMKSHEYSITHDKGTAILIDMQDGQYTVKDRGEKRKYEVHIRRKLMIFIQSFFRNEVYGATKMLPEKLYEVYVTN